MDGQCRAWGDDVQVFRRDDHTIGRLRHGKRGVRRQEFDQKAFVGGIEVLDQNEGKAGRRGKRAKEMPAGVQAASRSADSDDSDDGFRSALGGVDCRRDEILLR